MNETSIETHQRREFFDKHRADNKIVWARKLAEIDYMLFVIERYEVKSQSEVYQKRNVSDLKVLLEKRLMTFAHAEEHREYCDQSQHSGRKYPVKW